MRTKKSIFNVVSNVSVYIMKALMTFLVRTVFIHVLGKEILGLDGLYTNILSMLSVTELGVSVAIGYSLYKPLANKDYNEVSVIMSFYRKIYRIIGIVMITLGTILLLFLNSFVSVEVNVNIYLVYLLYLFDTVNQYFISYKEILILADQNNYKLFKIDFCSFLSMYILQIISLLMFKSFIIYVLIKLLIFLIRRIIINIYVSKLYKDVNFSCKEKLDNNTVKEIKTNVKGLMFHKIGNYVINGTDNIIISKFIDIVTVGIYTNYLSLTVMANSLLEGVYRGITASFGNLVVSEDTKIQESVFEKINFFGHLMYSFISISFLILINTFITLWIGKEYLLPFTTVIVICINFYITGMRLCLDSIKEASGTYYQDRYIPIIQAIINIVVSLLLVKPLGVLGVVIGTLVSSFIPMIHRPYIVYKWVFNTSPKKYYLNYIKNLIVGVVIAIIVYFVISYINLKVTLINFLLLLLIYIIVYILLVSIIYIKNDNYRYYVNLFKNKLFKKKNS